MHFGLGEETKNIIFGLLFPERDPNPAVFAFQGKAATCTLELEIWAQFMERKVPEQSSAARLCVELRAASRTIRTGIQPTCPC